MRHRLAPLQLLLAVVLAVTIAMPDWIAIWAGGHDIYAGLWGTEHARWDDMHVDLDIFGVAYVAFLISIVGVVLFVRAVFSANPTARPLAKKAMIATTVAMACFMGRMLIETGVVPSWAGIVGPLAALAAVFTLRDPA